jgi:small-conductance mechanosensitive channel
VVSLILAQAQPQVVSDSLTTTDWIVAAAVLVGSVIAAQVVKRVVRRAAMGSGVDERVARLVGRWVSYAVVLAGVIAFVVLLGVRFGPLFTAFTALGVAVAFALQDDLRNLWSGIQIQLRRPFKLGDEIATGEWEGTVEVVNLRATTLRTRDGKEIEIPNANVMLRGIDNRTLTPTRRTTLTVGVAYDTDLERAQQVLLEALSDVEGVESAPAPTAFVEAFAESTIDFAVRFWHGAATPDMWRARSAAAMAIKSALDTAGIEMAFPQRTVRIRRTP